MADPIPSLRTTSPSDLQKQLFEQFRPAAPGGAATIGIANSERQRNDIRTIFDSIVKPK